MSVRPPRICPCGHRVPSGVRCPCQAKRKAEHDKARPSARARGYDRAWEEAAREFLSQPENRTCARCNERPATVVMHIKSIRSRPDLRMDRRNWRPGCHRCNAVEAANERRGMPPSVSGADRLGPDEGASRARKSISTEKFEVRK